MAKRLLGLDIGPHRTHLVVLDYEKGQLSSVRLLESRAEGLEGQLAELRDALDGDIHFGDRLAAALPARTAYVRHLEFPFQDAKKIAAALPYELSAQVPVAVENCATASLQASTAADGSTLVTAAAVPKNIIDEILDPADAAGIPLHILDLSPFAFFAGLDDQISDGILVSSNEAETTVSLIKAGRLIDYRLLPGGADLIDADKADLLLREARPLLAKAGLSAATIYLMGSAATGQLAEILAQRGETAETISMHLAGETIPSAFVPAAALAVRAGATKDLKSFNFRQGSLALKGEWQKLKKSLITSACLGVLILAVLAAAAVVNYQDKAGQARALQKQMTEIYRETFPGATSVADIPMQMQSAIMALRERSSVIGGTQAGALAVIKEVSDLPEDLQIELQEFTYGPGETRLAGRADSFEAVNRISNHLAASPLFANAQVADAKMGLEGSRINFRLQLTLAGERVEQ